MWNLKHKVDLRVQFMLGTSIYECKKNYNNNNRIICKVLKYVEEARVEAYVPTTRSCADWMSVWKRGASADTSHL